LPAEGPDKPLYLPDFCTSRAALAIVLIVELTAFILTLARNNLAVGFWTDLARTSMFLLWIGLAGAGVLCLMGPRLKRLRIAQGSAAVLALITGLVALVSSCTFLLGRSAAIDGAGAGLLFPADPWAFLLRNVVIGFVVTALALRYFYVTHEWRRNIEMRATARVHALQARIRPHFLFNSMNTIASLTRSNPILAEQARTYQRIEQLRLGDRLSVDWKIDSLPRNALVPGLMLQPLLENAIYHGIEPHPQGGTVTITGDFAGGLITIVVRNPVGDQQNEREGNRLALANIRERLDLMYGGHGLVKAGRFDAEYIVTLRFPHIESRVKLAT
jgi:two-component system sensor histidine kinase AlgZ